MADDATKRLAGRALSRAARGRSLSESEAASLLQVTGCQQDELIRIAGRLRDLGLSELGRPGLITYSPNVFIPLTRLCRDRCHYCAFAASPAKLRAAGKEAYLDMDSVIDLARGGAAAGCAEALLTMGDRPEARWAAARDWLSARGYSATTEYLRDAAERIFRETGLLPHLNAGVLSWEEMARLRPVAASMGLMLESSSARLHREARGPHFKSPDKAPKARLAMIEEAGRLSIPFTTGVLIGIGETPEELIRSLMDLRRLARAHGHVQEVIVQNFRAKPSTPMAGFPDLAADPHVNAVAVARIILGPTMAVQVAPNLADVDELARLLAAGASDWGGISPVTPDHVNPERPWPAIDVLERATATVGMRLVPRLAAQPAYLAEMERWVPGAVGMHARALATPEGLLSPDALPVRRPVAVAHGYADVAQADAERPRVVNLDHEPNEGAGRGARCPVTGSTDWGTAGRRSLSPAVKAGLRLAETAPHRLAEEGHQDLALALMMSSGNALLELVEIADAIRRDRVGDDVTFVVNRNINFTNICYMGCGFCAFAQRSGDPDAQTLALDDIRARVTEAVGLGATEICMQGGIHPRLGADAYFELIDAVKEAAPGIHLHAFSPMEIHSAAARAGADVRELLADARGRGLDSMPGTAAEILDDEVRRILTQGKLPAAAWIDVVRSAHGLGIPTSATMMYGHVDHPVHWVGHLRALRRIQEETGGFTEFVGLPFIHENAPIYLSGRARPGPTPRDDLAVTAMARILLDGAIDNVQVSWVKLGPERCAELLGAGANDIGGTLMEESISGAAGAGHGSNLTTDGLRHIAFLAGRPARQRDTLYGPVSTDTDQAFAVGGVGLSDHPLW